MADDLAGMDEEGLRRLLAELLAANRATQANFDEIRQQFPIQPENLADSIPDWSELEEGGLAPPEEEGGFDEQLGVPAAGFSQVVAVEVRADGSIVHGGDGLTVVHVATGRYMIWIDNPQDPESFQWPSEFRALSPSSTPSGQAVNGNVNPKKESGKRGWEIRLVENVSASTLVDSQFHFSAANYEL